MGNQTYINSSNTCALAGGSGDWNVGPCTKMLWVSDPCNVPQATDQCLSLKSIDTPLGEDLKLALKPKDPSPPQRCECAFNSATEKKSISFQRSSNVPETLEEGRGTSGAAGYRRSLGPSNRHVHLQCSRLVRLHQLSAWSDEN